MQPIADTISYTHARNHLAAILDRVAESESAYVIKRQNKPGAVLLSEENFSSLLETLHLLRSRPNAQRLFDALERSYNAETPSQTLAALYEELGLAQAETEAEPTQDAQDGSA